jgi:hypothetical protein
MDSNTRVTDVITKNDVIRKKLGDMIQTFKPMDPIIHDSDGSVEVVFEINLNGGFAQLVLPKGIKLIEPVKPVGPPKPVSGSAVTSVEKGASQSSGKPKSEVHSGLIVDARGLGEVRPAMVPKIIDETGQEIYGPAFASREFAVRAGMSQYTKDIEAAIIDPRVQPNPLIIKGLKTKSLGRSSIVVSNSDASRLRRGSEHLSFLRKCKVIIVLD